MDNGNSNNGELPATEKQKEYVRDLIENMTREQASKVIDVLKNGTEIQPAEANGEPLITEKQKAYIKSILDSRGIAYSEERLSDMTRKQASELISKYAGEGAE